MSEDNKDDNINKEENNSELEKKSEVDENNSTKEENPSSDVQNPENQPNVENISTADENSDKKIVFSIVGPYEANLEKGLISISSPIARALLGKEEGSRVEVNTPSGLKNYEVLKINILN